MLLMVFVCVYVRVPPLLAFRYLSSVCVHSYAHVHVRFRRFGRRR
jgi:hypothetical protein